MSKFKKRYCILSLIFAAIVIVLALSISVPEIVHATTDTDANTNINNGLSISYNNGDGTLSGSIKILLVLTVISLAPSILIMMTSYTKLIICLHFVRAAIGTQTVPPNQILAGLALFLTLFIMSPVFTEINENAIKPLDAGTITQEEALELGMEPLRQFMFANTKEDDVSLFCNIQGVTYTKDNYQEVVTNAILIPSFILSQLREAFIIGFLIYIPFIVIDMVVSSVLMSMGMMMLPPTTISMPFKLLLFILVDGWDLVIKNLLPTFH